MFSINSRLSPAHSQHTLSEYIGCTDTDIIRPINPSDKPPAIHGSGLGAGPGPGRRERPSFRSVALDEKPNPVPGLPAGLREGRGRYKSPAARGPGLLDSAIAGRSGADTCTRPVMSGCFNPQPGVVVLILFSSVRYLGTYTQYDTTFISLHLLAAGEFTSTYVP